MVLTDLAQALGPRLAGVLAPFPVFAGIMAAFTHRLHENTPAVQLLRGVLVGSFAYAVFFLVIATLVQRLGIALTFFTACVASMTLQSFLVLWASRLGRIAPPRTERNVNRR